MADEIENSNRSMEAGHAAAIAAARVVVPRRWRPKGACHWCGEVVGPGQTHCDDDCQGDHEKAERAKGLQKR